MSDHDTTDAALVAQWRKPRTPAPGGRCTAAEEMVHPTPFPKLKEPDDIVTLAEQLEHHTRQAHESCPEVPEYAAILDVIAAWRAEKARADALDEAVTLALEDRDYFSDRLDAAEARATQAEQRAEQYMRDLAKCYRLSGADPDGEEDWRLAEHAVVAVTELRQSDMDASAEVDRLTRELAEAKAKHKGQEDK